LYTEPGDNGGVHINSGIPNHAFYLAAKALGGYSWERAGKVWYRTMTSGRIPVDCDFETFARVTVDVAGEGEFEGMEVREAVRAAWEQVGVSVSPAE
jgi:Zn-dependent metalloprotease